jgi:hypothetical protein
VDEPLRELVYGATTRPRSSMAFAGRAGMSCTGGGKSHCGNMDEVPSAVVGVCCTYHHSKDLG